MITFSTQSCLVFYTFSQSYCVRLSDWSFHLYHYITIAGILLCLAYFCYDIIIIIIIIIIISLWFEPSHPISNQNNRPTASTHV